MKLRRPLFPFVAVPVLLGGLLAADGTALAQDQPIDPFAPAAAEDPFAAPADDAFGAGDVFGAGGDDADPGANPFGAPGAAGEPFGGPAAAAGAVAPAEAAPPSPVVAELRRYAQGSTRQLALAIRGATRIGDWNEVNDYLAILAERKPSQAALAQAAATVGGSLLARLKSRPELSAASQQQVDALRAAARAAAEDVGRIDAAIAQIDSPDVDRRAGAFRTLLSGGDMAIARLAAAAALPDPPAARRSIAAVLKQLGRGAPAALRQLALYGADAQRAGALETLALLDPTEAVEDLVAALHAEDATDAERATAVRFLAPLYPSLPSLSETETYLVRKLNAADRVAAQTPATRTPQAGAPEAGAPAAGAPAAGAPAAVATTWAITEDRTAVAPQRTTARLAALQAAAIAAGRLQRLPVLGREALAAAVVSDLDYRVQLDPMFGSPEDIQSVRAAWGEDAIAGQRLMQWLEAALEQDRVAATIGVLRMLPPDPVLVTSYASEPTALVAATLHGEPRVRYEAALAVARTGADQPYAGSSYVLDRWVAMSQLKDRPTALVVEPRAGAADRLNAEIASYGYRVEAIRSVREAVRRVSQGGDVQVIVATTQLPDLPPVELVDRIRRQSLGRHVPIIFYGPPTDGLAGLDGSRWAAPVRRVNPPRPTIAQERYRVLADALQTLSEDLRFVLHAPPIRVPESPGEEGFFQHQTRYNAALDLVRAEQRQGADQRSVRFLGGLLDLGESPVAVALTPDAAVEDQQLQELFESLSFVYESVGDEAGLMRRLEERRPVHFLFLPARAIEGSAAELVERIRLHRRGSELPIFIYGHATSGLGSSASGLGDARFAPVIRRRASIEPAASFGSHMQEIIDAAALPPLGVDERQWYRDRAWEILAAVAADPALQFYDLRSGGIAAAMASATSGSRASQIAVLSGLGTPSSQAALTDLAAASALAMPLRVQAADGFARSVQRFGTRLSREQVALQYRRYNQATDPESRQVLGTVLDVMESRVAPSATPTVPSESVEEAASGSEPH